MFSWFEIDLVDRVVACSYTSDIPNGLHVKYVSHLCVCALECLPVDDESIAGWATAPQS